MSWTPFFLKRLGERGPDTHRHLFCAGAKGNPELVRTGETDAEVLINGTSGSDPENARAAVQRMVNALNDVWDDYMAGKFHAPGNLWVIRVVISTNELELCKQIDGAFIECLRYAGMVRPHDPREEGLQVFDLLPPDGVDSKAWSEMNAERMRSFGYNAVSAPSIL